MGMGPRCDLHHVAARCVRPLPTAGPTLHADGTATAAVSRLDLPGCCVGDGRGQDVRELIGAGLDHGFLVDLPEAAADRLLADAIRIDVPAGAIVYREEEPPRLFVVVTGILRAYMSASDGRQVTFRYGRTGDVMGLAFVIGGPGPLTIQAMTAASVVALRVETLRALLAVDPAVASVCAAELTRQLYQALDDVALSAFHSVRQRIARHLLDLATPEDDGSLVVGVGQQELADAIASAREVVARVLHELRVEGLIETGRDRIVLLDPAHLHDEAAVEHRDWRG
jgi:CRP/FNR family cyclic AMP-dependent transcriptional regulator